jgi:hypothetical protein
VHQIAEDVVGMEILVNTVNHLADTIAQCEWPDKLRDSLRTFIARYEQSIIQMPQKGITGTAS